VEDFQDNNAIERNEQATKNSLLQLSDAPKSRSDGMY